MSKELSPSSVLALAAASYFASVFGAGFLLGSIRVLFLVPRLGERIAELLEAPVMLAVILLAARHVVRRFALTAGLSAGVGLLALLLLLAAELLLAAALPGRSIREALFSRDPISGSVYLGSVLLYAALPWLHARAGMGAKRESRRHFASLGSTPPQPPRRDGDREP